MEGWKQGGEGVLEALLARCPSNHLAQDPCVGPPGGPVTHLPPTVGPFLTSAAGPGATGLESAACCSSATYWLYEEVQNAMLGSAWLKTSFRKQTQRAHRHTHMHTHTHLHTGTPKPAPLRPPVALSSSCRFTCCHEYRCVQFLCSGMDEIGGGEGKKRKESA